jgi:hypothetical protein
MGTIKDLTGKVFGQLTVLKAVGRKHGKCLWRCKCSCGKFTEVIGSSLNSKTIKGTQSCGCLSKKYFKDLTGKNFGQIKILQHLGKDNSKNNVYLAKCSCGKEIVGQGSDFKTSKIKSCGCGKFKSAVDNAKNNPFDAIRNTIYLDYKIKAEHRGFLFSLTLDEFTKLTESQCNYCGISYSNLRPVRRKYSAMTYLYNGIDRVNNEKGYSFDNCVPCCRICNQAKHTLNSETFVKWVEKMYNYQKTKKEQTKDIF